MKKSLIERVARELTRQSGLDPDQLEAGDVYGIDEYLLNGDPAYMRWRERRDDARRVIRMVRRSARA